MARPADRDDPPGAPADSTLTRTPAEAGDEQGYVDWHHVERTTVANVTLRAIKSLEIVALNRSLDRRNKLDRHSGNVLLILRGRVEGVFIADSCVSGVLPPETPPPRTVPAHTRLLPL